jgi:hypothetical protein
MFQKNKNFFWDWLATMADAMAKTQAFISPVIQSSFRKG